MLFISDWVYSFNFPVMLGQELIYFLFGGLFKVTDGNPKRILFPIFMNGLSKISSKVNLSEGFVTSNFLMRSIAYGGA